MSRKVIDFLIMSEDRSKVLIQKRSKNRKLFPDKWEIPGGHLENESILECIERELREETSMKLQSVYGRVHAFSWGDDAETENLVYLIAASGDYQPEAGKVSEHRWISRDEATILLEAGKEGEDLFDAVHKAFDAIDDLNTHNACLQLFTDMAHTMADHARRIALKYFRNDLGLKEKDDRSPVTKADQEIETYIRDSIRVAFPSHGILGEEDGGERLTAEHVWVIDPIDGTKAFATGKPLFATIIGLTHNGKPILGLIDQAFTKERWFAVGDRQTEYNGKPIKVAADRELSNARFYTACPEMFDGKLAVGFDALRSSVKWSLYNADCYAYGLLAMGQVDLVVEQYLGKHDIIGLVPIIKNACGVAVDLDNQEITLDNFQGSIVAASSANIAAAAIELLTKK